MCIFVRQNVENKDMNEVITSVQNGRVKRVLALQQKSSERRREGLFVVEGRRELGHLIEAGYEVDTVLFCRELLDEVSFVERIPCRERVEVSSYVYGKIAYRESTEGIMALVQEQKLGLQDLKLSEKSLVVVLERVEKPGNLGAILRSADAAGADAVIVCDPLTDLYNPNLIRSSIGACFTVPTVACTSEECIRFLKETGVQILTAQLQDSSLYYDVDMKVATALVMGTESTGLTQVWRDAADRHIRIPMLGRLDSLNVSVSTAILLFEAVRQRNSC